MAVPALVEHQVSAWLMAAPLAPWSALSCLLERLHADSRHVERGLPVTVYWHPKDREDERLVGSPQWEAQEHDPLHQRLLAAGSPVRHLGEFAA